MKHYQVDCAGCGATFVKYRIDRQFCSKACQMRAYRRAQKNKLDLLERLIDKLNWRQKPTMPDLFA
jgi:predicted nucleic acid-binding Zn ribbon protein